ncbi:HotDog domain-containing protein [Tricharina praecox]|uniref:HotDog domain-containing protein n=1 Tax=Tricharina praecox TaxID=43433 RepID=UPI0022208DCF|nr:HotDog domain-containing protein [Tricharina praecox]KAI5845918.1 HotDog domain-containing protein [Tricharina praecox]
MPPTAPNPLKSRTLADYPHKSTHSTRWSDNDQYGHLNNSVYAFLIDSAVNSYLISHCGLVPTPTPTPSPSSAPSSTPTTQQQPQPQQQIGLVISSHCTYFLSLSFPEAVELGLCVRRLGTSSVQYEVGFFRVGGGDKVCAVGGFTHVFVDARSRRPVKALEAKMRCGLERILVGEGGARL